MNSDNSNLLLVHMSILPDNYLLVVKARELLESDNITISKACKKVGISRNTFYKYKDYVFRPTKDIGKKAIISFKVEDTKGVLSSIMGLITSCNGNIITINQEVPINNIAFIVIAINYIDLNVTLDECVSKLKELKGVKSINIIAYE